MHTTAVLAFFLGLVSACAQVILIRELMTAFSGHEIVFAIVLALWLAGVGAGSFWARGSSVAVGAGLLALAAFMVPLTVIGARLFKPCLGIPLGSMAEIPRVALAAGVILIPLTVLLGAVFGILARGAWGAGRVYALEALGFMAGGLWMTFSFITPLPPGLDAAVRQAAWPGYTMAAVQRTRYGDLVLAERGGEKSLFENGRLLLTGHDALSAEEVHLPLAAHPAPLAVFLVGGGFSQAGAEALKHPLTRLDYVELDPGVLAMEAGAFGTPSDPRLHLDAMDPRAALGRTAQMYDVMMLNAGDPVNLAAGRLFTREFFLLAREHLGPGGIFAVTISLGENYVNTEGKAYARAVMAALKAVFPYVAFVPGERLTFLASRMPVSPDAALWSQRLEGCGVALKFMHPFYLKDRLSPERVREVSLWLAEGSFARVSTDDRPSIVTRAMVFMAARSGSALTRLIGFFETWGWGLWWVVPLVWGAGCWDRMRVDRPFLGAGVAGFTQMIFQVAVIFAVQGAFGCAYGVVGVLSAGFMLGIFAGAQAASRLSWHTGVMAGAGLQVMTALALPAALRFFPAGLFVIPVLAGVALGLQFTVYAAMAGVRRAGSVYAADVAGAALGAVGAGIFLVPLWGISRLALFLIVLNLAVVIGWRNLASGQSVSAGQ